MAAAHLVAQEVGHDAPPLPSAERIQELLFEAARLGRTDVIPALIQAGADIEACSERGHSPLVLASYQGHERTVELLLSLGAQPDGRDDPTGTGSALMGVAFKGHLAIAQMLLDAGADPQHRNAAGQTALMMAALFDRRSILTLLLDAGADVTAQDASSNDAASIAQAQGNEALAPLLSCQAHRPERRPDMCNKKLDKPAHETDTNPARSAREEFSDELRNPGMNAQGRTGAGAGKMPPSEAEADAVTSRTGEQAGTQRDDIHKTEDDDPAIPQN